MSNASFEYSVGDVVLAEWGRKVFYAKIVSLSPQKSKCKLVFDDGSQEEVDFSRIHSVNETTTEIICVVCKDDATTNQNEIVLCDICSVGFHQHCHDPVIQALALEYDAPWTCFYCKLKKKNPHIEINPFNNHNGEDCVQSEQKEKVEKILSEEAVNKEIQDEDILEHKEQHNSPISAEENSKQREESELETIQNSVSLSRDLSSRNASNLEETNDRTEKKKLILNSTQLKVMLRKHEKNNNHKTQRGIKERAFRSRSIDSSSRPKYIKNGLTETFRHVDVRNATAQSEEHQESGQNEYKEQREVEINVGKYENKNSPDNFRKVNEKEFHIEERNDYRFEKNRNKECFDVSKIRASKDSPKRHENGKDLCHKKFQYSMLHEKVDKIGEREKRRIGAKPTITESNGRNNSREINETAASEKNTEKCRDKDNGTVIESAFKYVKSDKHLNRPGSLDQHRLKLKINYKKLNSAETFNSYDSMHCVHSDASTDLVNHTKCISGNASASGVSVVPNCKDNFDRETKTEVKRKDLPRPDSEPNRTLDGCINEESVNVCDDSYENDLVIDFDESEIGNNDKRKYAKIDEEFEVIDSSNPMEFAASDTNGNLHGIADADEKKAKTEQPLASFCSTHNHLPIKRGKLKCANAMPHTAGKTMEYQNGNFLADKRTEQKERKLSASRLPIKRNTLKDTNEMATCSQEEILHATAFHAWTVASDRYNRTNISTSYSNVSEILVNQRISQDTNVMPHSTRELSRNFHADEVGNTRATKIDGNKPLHTSYCSTNRFPMKRRISEGTNVTSPACKETIPDLQTSRVLGEKVNEMERRHSPFTPHSSAYELLFKRRKSQEAANVRQFMKTNTSVNFWKENNLQKKKSSFNQNSPTDLIVEEESKDDSSLGIRISEVYSLRGKEAEIDKTRSKNGALGSSSFKSEKYYATEDCCEKTEDNYRKPRLSLDSGVSDWSCEEPEMHAKGEGKMSVNDDTASGQNSEQCVENKQISSQKAVSLGCSVEEAPRGELEKEDGNMEKSGNKTTGRRRAAELQKLKEQQKSFPGRRGSSVEHRSSTDLQASPGRQQASPVQDSVSVEQRSSAEKSSQEQQRSFEQQQSVELQKMPAQQKSSEEQQRSLDKQRSAAQSKRRTSKDSSSPLTFKTAIDRLAFDLPRHNWLVERLLNEKKLGMENVDTDQHGSSKLIPGKGNKGKKAKRNGKTNNHSNPEKKDADSTITAAETRVEAEGQQSGIGQMNNETKRNGEEEYHKVEQTDCETQDSRYQPISGKNDSCTSPCSVDKRYSERINAPQHQNKNSSEELRVRTAASQSCTSSPGFVSPVSKVSKSLGSVASLAGTTSPVRDEVEPGTTSKPSLPTELSEQKSEQNSSAHDTSRHGLASETDESMMPSSASRASDGSPTSFATTLKQARSVPISTKSGELCSGDDSPLESVSSVRGDSSNEDSNREDFFKVDNYSSHGIKRRYYMSDYSKTELPSMDEIKEGKVHKEAKKDDRLSEEHGALIREKSASGDPLRRPFSGTDLKEPPPKLRRFSFPEDQSRYYSEFSDVSEVTKPVRLDVSVAKRNLMNISINQDIEKLDGISAVTRNRVVSNVEVSISSMQQIAKTVQHPAIPSLTKQNSLVSPIKSEKIHTMPTIPGAVHIERPPASIQYPSTLIQKAAPHDAVKPVNKQALVIDKQQNNTDIIVPKNVDSRMGIDAKRQDFFKGPSMPPHFRPERPVRLHSVHFHHHDHHIHTPCMHEDSPNPNMNISLAVQVDPAVAANPCREFFKSERHKRLRSPIHDSNLRLNRTPENQIHNMNPRLENHVHNPNPNLDNRIHNQNMTMESQIRYPNARLRNPMHETHYQPPIQFQPKNLSGKPRILPSGPVLHDASFPGHSPYHPAMMNVEAIANKLPFHQAPQQLLMKGSEELALRHEIQHEIQQKHLSQIHLSPSNDRNLNVYQSLQAMPEGLSFLQKNNIEEAIQLKSRKQQNLTQSDCQSSPDKQQPGDNRKDILRRILDANSISDSTKQELLAFMSRSDGKAAPPSSRKDFARYDNDDRGNTTSLQFNQDLAKDLPAFVAKIENPMMPMNGMRPTNAAPDSHMQANQPANASMVRNNAASTLQQIAHNSTRVQHMQQNLETNSHLKRLDIHNPAIVHRSQPDDIRGKHENERISSSSRSNALLNMAFVDKNRVESARPSQEMRKGPMSVENISRAHQHPRMNGLQNGSCITPDKSRQHNCNFSPSSINSNPFPCRSPEVNTRQIRRAAGSVYDRCQLPVMPTGNDVSPLPKETHGHFEHHRHGIVGNAKSSEAASKQEHLRQLQQMQILRRHQAAMQEADMMHQINNARRQEDRELVARKSHDNIPRGHPAINLREERQKHDANRVNTSQRHQQRERLPDRHHDSDKLQQDCEACGKGAQFVCSRCRSGWYCSESCQVKHWREHCRFCK